MSTSNASIGVCTHDEPSSKAMLSEILQEIREVKQGIATDMKRLTKAIRRGNADKETHVEARKKKNKDLPSKKTISAYLLFCKDTRPVLKKDQPDLTFGELGKRLGEMWKNASEDVKKEYKEKALMSKNE